MVVLGSVVKATEFGAEVVRLFAVKSGDKLSNVRSLWARSGGGYV